MNKYRFKEVRNGVPVFREVNSFDKPNIKMIGSTPILYRKLLELYEVAENSLREYDLHQRSFSIDYNIYFYTDFQEVMEIGDTVTADIHEGKLINLKLVDQPEKFPIEQNDSPRTNHSVRRLYDPQ